MACGWLMMVRHVIESFSTLHSLLGGMRVNEWRQSKMQATQRRNCGLKLHRKKKTGETGIKPATPRLVVLDVLYLKNAAPSLDSLFTHFKMNGKQLCIFTLPPFSVWGQQWSSKFLPLREWCHVPAGWVPAGCPLLLVWRSVRKIIFYKPVMVESTLN